jgi:hypothetical protein
MTANESLNNVFPKLQKTIKKVILFESNPNQYALYIWETDRFIILPQTKIDNILEIAELSDGHHSVAELITNNSFSGEDNINTLALMNKLNLFNQDMTSGNRFSETKMFSKQLISFSFSFNRNSAKWFRCIYWSVICALLIVSFLCAIKEWNSFLFSFTMGKTNLGIFGYFATLAMMIPVFVIHEFAHVAVACKYGLYKNITINISLYFYFIPYIYVKIPGLYTLKKNERIKILVAGVFSNFLLSLVFINIYFFSKTEFFFFIAVSNFQIIIVNLLPFNLTDGYFIFSNILKKNNLRKKYFDFIAHFGVYTSKECDKTEYLYIITSTIYMWVFIAVESYIFISAFFSFFGFFIKCLISVFLVFIFFCGYVLIIKITMIHKGVKKA